MANPRVQIIIEALNLAKGEMQALDKEMKGLETTTKKAGDSFDAFKKSASLALSAAGIAAGKFALDFTKASVLTAARVDTLGVVTETLGRNVGKTAEEIHALEAAIQAQGITTQASRQAIAQMIQANLDLAGATDLARLAQDAAVISGENSSEAFQALVTVIATGNTLMARRRGLLVDFQGAYELAAKAAGKTAEELTELEKVQIRTNEVMAQGVNIAGAYEAAMETGGKKLSSYARHWEELQVAFGAGLQDIFVDGIDLVTDWTKELGNAIKAENAIKQAAEDGLISRKRANELITQATFGSMTFADALKILSEAEAGMVFVNNLVADSYENYVYKVLGAKVATGEMEQAEADMIQQMMVADEVGSLYYETLDVLRENMWEANRATDGWMTGLSTLSPAVWEAATAAGSFDKVLRGMDFRAVEDGLRGLRASMNRGPVDGMVEALDLLAGATGRLSSVSSTNLGNFAQGMIDNFDFAQAGGVELQEIMKKIGDAKIEPEVKLEKLQEGLVIGTNIDIELGKIKAIDGQKMIRDAFGLDTLQEAKDMLDAAGTDIVGFANDVDTAIMGARTGVMQTITENEKLARLIQETNDISLDGLTEQFGFVYDKVLGAYKTGFDLFALLTEMNGMQVGIEIGYGYTGGGVGGKSKYVKPEKVLPRAQGGKLTGVNLVGEEGQELIINGIVIPHRETQALLGLGLIPGSALAIGGPLNQGGSGIPGLLSSAPNFNDPAIRRAITYKSQISGQGAGSSAGFSTSQATQDAHSVMVIAQTIAQQSADQSMQATQQIRSAMVQEISASNARSENLLNDINATLGNLATSKDIIRGVRDAVELAAL